LERRRLPLGHSLLRRFPCLQHLHNVFHFPKALNFAPWRDRHGRRHGRHHGRRK
jgi:hypothetical protein